MDLPFWKSSARFPAKPFKAFVISKPFNASLGYPGEGPACCCFGVFGVGFWGLCGVMLLAGCALAMAPSRTEQNAAARADRSASVPLQSGRPVQQMTRSRREKLRALFSGWLLGQGRSFDGVLLMAKTDVDTANELLILYGKWLYESGKPYSFYSETINMFSSECPAIRRLLQPGFERSLQCIIRRCPGRSWQQCLQFVWCMAGRRLLASWL